MMTNYEHLNWEYRQKNWEIKDTIAWNLDFKITVLWVMSCGKLTEVLKVLFYNYHEPT